MAPVQVAMLVSSAPVRALLCLASLCSLEELYVLCLHGSLCTLDELFGIRSPAAVLDSALLDGRNSEKREVAAAVLLQLAHQRSGIAYPGCNEMTGASFVGPNPIPPLWWKSSFTSCGSCAGGYVG